MSAEHFETIFLSVDQMCETAEPDPRLFKCTLCPLKYDDKTEFHAHVRDHFKPITCQDCNKTFIGDKQYSYHRRHFHLELLENERRTAATAILVEKEYVEEVSLDSVESAVSSVACDVCGRLFPNDKAVTRHRKTHTNEGKRFFCNVCNSGFNKKTNLEFHLRIHTNER